MRKIVLALLFISFFPINTQASDYNERKTLKDSLSVIDEIMNSPDQGIPSELISQAKAILIFPTLIKAGFLVGGRYGEGLASMRAKKNGKFGPPTFPYPSRVEFWIPSRSRSSGSSPIGDDKTRFGKLT